MPAAEAIVIVVLDCMHSIACLQYSEHAPIRFRVWGVALRMFLKWEGRPRHALNLRAVFLLLLKDPGTQMA